MKNYKINFITSDGRVIWERLQAVNKNEALEASIIEYDFDDLHIMSVHIAEFIED